MRMRTEQETERAMLDSLTGLTEALANMGKIADADVAELQADRLAVGAQPLRLEKGSFDASAIVPTPDLGPDRIKAIREREGASQAVLAMHLGVAVATLSQWERGRRRPDGPALRLLSLIERHGLAHVR